jgi:Growth-Arrest-Specific Protein 2 Domain
LQEEQLSAADYKLDIENKLYKANKTSLELLRLVKEAEAENEQLQREKEYYQSEIIALKKRYELYVPVKGDMIDMRLAEYINNYPDRSRLKIMFQRESEGVYIFGTKRVNIRVDNNNINVRVGGGYLSIDEFIEQYTPSELERMIR